MKAVIVQTSEAAHSIENQQVLVPFLRVKSDQRATSSPQTFF